MHHLTFCIISIFDIWPCESKFELHGASEGTETFESCNLPEAHSWLVLQWGLDARPPGILPGTPYPQHLHRIRACGAQNLHRAEVEQEFAEGRTMCIYEEEIHT